jgi:hypothetical protein
MIKEKKVDLIRECVTCHEVFHFEVNTPDWEKYNSGEPIQNCFPYLTADDRELFISGLCGSCFDKLFSFDEDDGDDYSPYDEDDE